MIAALSAWFAKWTSQIVVAAIIMLAAATWLSVLPAPYATPSAMQSQSPKKPRRGLVSTDRRSQ
ncbi:hypothetical protein DEA98_14700 [Brucella pseudogrignonensis]|nr:hypothetical protein [Brucella pseudogrignonensis]